MDAASRGAQQPRVRADRYRLDIYHLGLLFLQILSDRALRIYARRDTGGSAAEMAVESRIAFFVRPRKTLRRHVSYRTESAMELWRDLHTTAGPAANATPAPANAPESTEQPDATG